MVTVPIHTSSHQKKPLHTSTTLSPYLLAMSMSRYSASAPGFLPSLLDFAFPGLPFRRRWLDLSLHIGKQWNWYWLMVWLCWRSHVCSLSFDIIIPMHHPTLNTLKIPTTAWTNKTPQRRSVALRSHWLTHTRPPQKRVSEMTTVHAFPFKVAHDTCAGLWYLYLK